MKKSIATLLTFGVFLLGNSFCAADYYVSGMVGNAEPDEDGFKDDTSTKFAFGYVSSETWSFEAAYTNLGEFDADSSTLALINSVLASEFPGLGATANSASLEVTGLEVSVIANFGLSETIDAYARMGLYAWDSEVAFSFTVPGVGSGSGSEDDSGSDLSVGLGLEFEVSEGISINGEYTMYEAFEGDITNLGLGLKVRF